MKITLTTPHKLLLVISVFLTLTAYAESNNECQNQSLSPKGLAVAGSTITPGQNVTISLFSDKGKPEATVVLKLKKMKNAVVVNGEIKNIGSCELSTHMPVSLYPIRNGLPLGWHSLPEGVEISNPSLQPGRSVKFYKEYSIDYAGGFNLKVGTFNISPFNESVENNADACSDKAIAKQLEQLADKEIKGEFDVCQSAQTMNKLNEGALAILNKCPFKSQAKKQLRQEIERSVAEVNSRIAQTCVADSRVSNSAINVNKKMSKSKECSDVYARVQAIYNEEEQGVNDSCEATKASVRALEKALKIYEECDYQNDIKVVQNEIGNSIQETKRYCK